MPCDSSYLDPTQLEKETRRAAQLYMYVATAIAKRVPGWVQSAAADQYAKDERVIPALCELMNGLSDEERERIVYHNPKDRTARDLANWWEDHQAADAAREAQKARDAARKEQLIAGLSKEDRRILGIHS